jgi:hypothetical protein
MCDYYIGVSQRANVYLSETGCVFLGSSTTESEYTAALS